MPLLNDIHHLTLITSDLGRLIAFYQRVFGARVTVDLEEEGLRHAFIDVVPHTVFHEGRLIVSSERMSSSARKYDSS